MVPGPINAAVTSRPGPNRNRFISAPPTPAPASVAMSVSGAARQNTASLEPYGSGPTPASASFRYSSSAGPESSSVELLRRAKKISRDSPFREANTGAAPGRTSTRATKQLEISVITPYNRSAGAGTRSIPSAAGAHDKCPTRALSSERITSGDSPTISFVKPRLNTHGGGLDPRQLVNVTIPD